MIKFTTLFGVLAVGLAIELHEKGYDNLKYGIAGAVMLISMFFAYRSFYGMRIGEHSQAPTKAVETNLQGRLS